MPDNIAYQYIPFIRKGDDSSRVVEGHVSGNGNVDLDNQIVDPAWLKSELPTWLAAYGNVREQHNPARAVGKAQSVDTEHPVGPYMAAKIVDNDAWQKVKEGVYNGFSVGIKNPRIVSDPLAKNGRIVGGRLIEVSIVDRPANDAAKFVVLKRAGAHEWKLGTDGPVIEDTAKAAATADVAKCDLPGCDCACTPGAPDQDCDCPCAYCAAAKEATVDADTTKAPMSAAAQNDLPDDAFAYIEPGGEKDSGGKTTPRSKRHYPIHDDAHIRNALSRAAAQIKAGGQPAEIARKALPKIHSAAKARGIGDDDKEKSAMTDQEQQPASVTAPDADKAAASHVEHKHPYKGTHNHAHDDRRGGLHTHAHLHNDDDMHDHPHLANTDARLLSPEERDAATLMQRNSSDRYMAATPDATKADGETPAPIPVDKAAADFAATEQGGSLNRPAAIGAVSALLKDALQRITALEGQTDHDKDGDVDTPANMAGGAMEKRPDAEFQAQRPDPASIMIRPGALDLTFASEADLKKYIDTTVADLTKAATADTTTATTELVKLAGGLAKGFEAVTSRLEASAREAEATKAALASVEAELAKVKELAQPVKGATFPVEKGLGLEPDRIYLGGAPEGVSRKQAAAQVLAGLNEQDRLDVHRALLEQMYGQR